MNLFKSTMKREVLSAIKKKIPTLRDLEIIKYAAVEAFHFKAKPKTRREAAPVAVVPPLHPAEPTKMAIREAFEHHMAQHRIGYVDVTGIVWFKGVRKASYKAAQNSIFTKAKVVWSNSDAVLKDIRFQSLQAKKTLLMKPRMLGTAVASQVVPRGTKDIYLSSLKRTGDQDLPLAPPVHIDAYFVESVAVSRTGRRVGVSGSSNLQYGMLGSSGFVDVDVPVITIVHDCQVIDLPEIIFTPRDVHVDYIATPTRWIQCPRRTDPPMIQWNQLNQADLEGIPVLMAIQQLPAGVNVVVADE